MLIGNANCGCRFGFFDPRRGGSGVLLEGGKVSVREAFELSFSILAASLVMSIGKSTPESTKCDLGFLARFSVDLCTIEVPKIRLVTALAGLLWILFGV